MFYKIVPFDSGDYMCGAFTIIFSTFNRSVRTKAVYTDNVRSDANMIAQAHIDVFGTKSFVPECLQVNFLYKHYT